MSLASHLGDPLGGTLARSDVAAGGPERSASRVPTTTHKFWESLAVLGGAVLIAHAVLSLSCLDQPLVFAVFSWAELVIGCITVGVDVWFLTHV
jgi:hypothetical protein